MQKEIKSLKAFQRLVNPEDAKKGIVDNQAAWAFYFAISGTF